MVRCWFSSSGFYPVTPIIKNEKDLTIIPIPRSPSTPVPPTNGNIQVHPDGDTEPDRPSTPCINDNDDDKSTGSIPKNEPKISNIKLENIKRRPGVPITGKAQTNKKIEIPFHKKSSKDYETIKMAIEGNDFLSKIIKGKCLETIINAMVERPVKSNQMLIKQGDTGSEMFVSKTGKYKIQIKDKTEKVTFNDSRVFGELAILYDGKRMASIKAATSGIVWVLSREVFQAIIINDVTKSDNEVLLFLKSVKYLNSATDEALREVSKLLKPEFFTAGTAIIKQGDRGDKFYIIRAGIVTVSKSGEGVKGKLVKGQCFGEIALQKEDTRQATVTAEPPGVECLTLTRRDFIRNFGDVEIPTVDNSRNSFENADIAPEYEDIVIEKDLKIIKTLGIGGFGRVELVQHKKKHELIFALKYMRKFDIVHQQQEQHVYYEKIIQMKARSPFIIRMYRTFKDNKFVYFLLEYAPGGDLFKLLHSQHNQRFEEKDAKFLSGCTLEALGYLHSKGIIYRDLKPENLMIDKHGYLKLTDFGFAKPLPIGSKTFTFAGTPDYVAPEIVMNRGHDRGVDYWGFGALIFELLTGQTPFCSNDPSFIKTYNKIMNGIDNVRFPAYVKPRARNIIEKLCRPLPAERLGMQKNGVHDIKMHKWYDGFDWNALAEGKIPSPFKPTFRNSLDTRYFDEFKPNTKYPPEEVSGWDENF